MAQDDEAQPKQTRRRRSTYAKRVELRLTESQLDIASRAREAASEATGRNVTLSEIVRSSVEDGCRSIVKAMKAAPVLSSAGSERITESFVSLTDVVQLARGEIRRIGHNVNAMGKNANITGRIEGELSEITAQLAALDQHLVGVTTAIINNTAQEDDDDD